MLSDSHIDDGLKILGASNNERFMKIINVLEEVGNKNLLKEQANQIITVIDGQKVVIRAFVENGVCINVNAFPNETQRLLGNVIVF